MSACQLILSHTESIRTPIKLMVFSQRTIWKLTGFISYSGQTKKKNISHHWPKHKRKEVKGGETETAFLWNCLNQAKKIFCTNLTHQTTITSNESQNQAFTRLLCIQIQFYNNKFTHWTHFPTRNTLGIAYYAGSKYAREFSVSQVL